MGQVTQREKKRTSFRLADTEEGDLVMRPEDLRRPRPPPKTQLEGSPVSPFLLPIIRGLRFPHTSPGGRQKGCQRKNPRFRVRPCLHLLLVQSQAGPRAGQPRFRPLLGGAKDHLSRRGRACGSTWHSGKPHVQVADGRDSGERSGRAEGAKAHVRRLSGFSNDIIPRFSNLNNQLQL